MKGSEKQIKQEKGMEIERNINEDFGKTRAIANGDMVDIWGQDKGHGPVLIEQIQKRRKHSLRIKTMGFAN